MRESYTFSRALHLMRYGNVKMRHVMYDDGVYLYFDRVSNTLRIHFPDSSDTIAQLDGIEVAGSFTEYVPELDGVK